MNKLNYRDPSEDFLASTIELIKSRMESSRETEPKRSDKIYGQKLQLFTLKKEFQNDLLDIRRKLGIPGHGFKAFNDMSEWAAKILAASEAQKKLTKEVEEVGDPNPNAAFAGHLNFLVEKFGIADRWSLTISAYLFFDRIQGHDLLPDPIEIGWPELPSREADNYVDIRIHNETTKSDLEDKWEAIKKQRSFHQSGATDLLLDENNQLDIDQGQINKVLEEYKDLQNQRKKTYGSEKFKRNIISLKLKRAGKSSKEIKDILQENNLVKDNLTEDHVTTFSDVNNFIKDIRQKIDSVALN